jgi:ribosomal protein L37AE/L43A
MSLPIDFNKYMIRVIEGESSEKVFNEMVDEIEKDIKEEIDRLTTCPNCGDDMEKTFNGDWYCEECDELFEIDITMKNIKEK